MKRVLVTGATGFIGRHCLPLLSEGGYEVYAVSTKEPKENQSGVHWHQVDLLDIGFAAQLIATVRPTHLLHFAWYAVPGEYWSSLENFHWVQASLGLLQAFEKAGGRRVVMAGTCAEYDWTYGYCSEQRTPLLPSGAYGACKHSMQIMLDGFARQTRISAAWGRIFFLYGPHEHPHRLVSSVICSALKREPIRCSHGNQIRDFLHVHDGASAFVALLNSDVSGPVNIASGRPVVLKDIIYKLAGMLGQQNLVELGAVHTSASEPPLLVADVARLSNEVGWHPTYDLDHGLDHTIDWWKSNLEHEDR